MKKAREMIINIISKFSDVSIEDATKEYDDSSDSEMLTVRGILLELLQDYATEAIKADRVRVKDELKIIFKDESISTLACKEIDKLPIDLP